MSLLPLRLAVLATVNLLPQGLLHDRVEGPVLHLDRLGPRMDVDGVSDEVCLAVPSNRDDVGKLQQHAENLLPQSGISLESRGILEPELGCQPLDLVRLRKGIKLLVSGGCRGR